MSKSLLDQVMNNPVPFAIAGGVVLGVVYLVGRTAVKDAATAVSNTVGGVISGNNAVTQGTPYEGAGVLGTIGAATNAASGGFFQMIGEKFGGWVYEISHPEWNGTPKITSSDVIRNGAANTDTIWGPIGQVVLKQ